MMFNSLTLDGMDLVTEQRTNFKFRATAVTAFMKGKQSNVAEMIKSQPKDFIVDPLYDEQYRKSILT